MKKYDVVTMVLGERLQHLPRFSSYQSFAPSNIALCKYWGKRNQELNLPMTSSLSISLGTKGASTELSVHDESSDFITLNGKAIEPSSAFAKRLSDYLNLFRTSRGLHFKVVIESNIPIAAGLASSACGFAAVILALNGLFGWGLSDRELSILARLGSGSASRSITLGFVEWHAGLRNDGMDSYSEQIIAAWPELCIGLLILSQEKKMMSSREAMQCTIATSPLYSAWPAKVMRDLSNLKKAIQIQDFHLLGVSSESNAMTMHATMLSSWPPISYAIPETVIAMQNVWQLRREGLPLFFTQDAGPNLKLLFLDDAIPEIKKAFPQVEIVRPFLPE